MTAGPPWSGWIETTGDALIIFEAAKRNLIPRVTRRLVDNERSMIMSGSVFVFNEEESGIKRWTDGCYWSPSRILGNFLLYRETDKKGASHGSKKRKQEELDSEEGEGEMEGESLSRPKNQVVHGVDRNEERKLMGSLTNSVKFKKDGLMKKTLSMTINGSTHHLISYYKIADVTAGRLRTPSTLPEFVSLEISPVFLDKANFRCPPKMELDPDGHPRYRGEADEVLAQGMDLGLGISAAPIRVSRSTSNGKGRNNIIKGKARDLDEQDVKPSNRSLTSRRHIPAHEPRSPPTSRIGTSRKRELHRDESLSPTPTSSTLKRAKVESVDVSPLRVFIPSTPATQPSPSSVKPPPIITPQTNQISVSTAMQATPTSSNSMSSSSLAAAAAAYTQEASQQIRVKQSQSLSDLAGPTPQTQMRSLPSMVYYPPSDDSPSYYPSQTISTLIPTPNSWSTEMPTSWSRQLQHEHSLASYHTPFSPASASSLNAALVPGPPKSSSAPSHVRYQDDDQYR
ncbi:hypothetical protein MIND_01292400 [Mycena indigotica]|uniref:Uncharacterized protein n=1 Tax=Mycena indigotica TaxID=2126181 RepID=A0A8H6RZE6_9AGAR|nr:uncharacterized protein MIND_01292400 [Mycena indigotica]KAF7290525.1 hypothetical protein MIND_01292400 [Mycena indigotica]